MNEADYHWCCKCSHEELLSYDADRPRHPEDTFLRVCSVFNKETTGVGTVKCEAFVRKERLNLKGKKRCSE